MAIAVAISPSGKTLLSSGNDGIIRLWDISTGKLLKLFRGHNKPVWDVKFSPDGKRFASAGGDEVVRLWDIASGREIGK